MIIQSAAKWARAELGDAELGDSQLGDARRTARVVKVATALAQSPGGTLPDPISKWAELKAAYRLCNHPKITFQRLLQSHWTRTQLACAPRGSYLLIEDTTTLDYTAHKSTQGLGRIGDDQGRGFFFAHDSGCAHRTLVGGRATGAELGGGAVAGPEDGGTRRSG